MTQAILTFEIFKDAELLTQTKCAFDFQWKLELKQYGYDHHYWAFFIQGTAIPNDSISIWHKHFDLKAKLFYRGRGKDDPHEGHPFFFREIEFKEPALCTNPNDFSIWIENEYLHSVYHNPFYYIELYITKKKSELILSRYYNPLKDFSDAFQGSDIQISLNGLKFHCHRQILNVFAPGSSNNLPSNTDPLLFQAFLSIIYGKKVNISAFNISSLLSLCLIMDSTVVKYYVDDFLYCHQEDYSLQDKISWSSRYNLQKMSLVLAQTYSDALFPASEKKVLTED